MVRSDPGLRRIALHAGAAHAELALPDDVPIATLMPSVVDILGLQRDQPNLPAALPYRLSRVGEAALDDSKTLAQHAVHDGAVLLLTRGPFEPPAPRFDDPVDQVASTVRAAVDAWTPQTARHTAAVTAAGLSALAGFLAIPGGPGAPNALLAAATATAVAVATTQLAGCDGPAVTAVCCMSFSAGIAALVMVLAAVPAGVAGALAATAAIGLLRVAARVSIHLTGLTGVPEPACGDAPSAIRAHRLLAGLVAGLSTVAALGVVAAAADGAPHFGKPALAAAASAALLLRARSHGDRHQIVALIGGGVVALGVAVAAMGAAAPQHRPGLCATAAALAGAALWLGFQSPTPPPLIGRALEVLEYAALVSLAPITCWLCGWYGAARGLALS